MTPALDIIVPVHNAYEHLVACLDAVDATAPGAAVYVVDDASTDPRIAPCLERWTGAGQGRKLASNARNLGFVRTVNRAMARSRNDVVLLNSDTLVAGDWHEALARCLASDPAIATATPWSNNGEIVSFPEFCRANPVPEQPGRLAWSARESKRGPYPDLPTAVGFCMAIARSALEELGPFDEQAFGRGYGEENDFSLRAAQAGWRNVLCDDAYVAHVGGRSFGPLGLAPGEDSMQRLLGKHPDYARLVADFIERDPLAERREAMRAALASEPERMG